MSEKLVEKFVSPFTLPANEYKRDINVLKQSVDDAARYLSRSTGEPFEDCRQFVITSIRPSGKREIKDPTVRFFKRTNYEDRYEEQEPLSKYLGSVIQRGDIIAPTLTVYIHPREKESVLVNYIDSNVKARGTAKKAMFKAEREGNKDLQKQKNIEQTNAKLSNNAVSGAHVSASTPLFNKSAHSSLTSTCRSTSGYGNANNEKMLCGNRHYWAPRIVLNNLVSIINNTNYTRLHEVIHKYNLVIPSAEDVMDCITYSTKLYGIHRNHLKAVEEFVFKMKDLDRAAFVYTGDLYHLKKHNEAFMRDLIQQLVEKPTVPEENPSAVYALVPEEYVQLGAQLCEEECKGKKDSEIINTLADGLRAAAARQLAETILKYNDFIKAFFVTANVPASVARFPSSIRRAALVSDTDSTIFTVQDWVSWYFGEIKFGPRANGVSATMIFLASQAIVHVLARMSANFGIEESRLFQIAMKNEFKFDVFIVTQIAKHYFALIGCQEGNLYAKYKKEIKGVHLKSSNAPKKIMAAATAMMEEIMYDVTNGKLISMMKLLKQIGDIEREIIASIKSGSIEYFRRGQIKNHDAYKKSPEESPYINYVLWKEVFAPKYGDCDEPPFVAVKLNGMIDSPTKTKEWLETFEDKELKARLEAWMVKNNKKYFGTFHIPKSVIDRQGIPPEILRTVNVRAMVKDTTNVFAIILESLGFYYTNKKITRLISDEY